MSTVKVVKQVESSDFSELLTGYTKVQDVTKLKTGDSIRYKSDNTFKKGGVIKLIHEKYLVLLNPVSKQSWSVQLTNPTLTLWVKTLAVKKEEGDKGRQLAKFFQGSDVDKVIALFEKVKDYDIDNVLKIYKQYTSGKLKKV